MQKEYLILLNGEKVCGAVKLIPGGKGIIADITIEGSIPLKEGEVFKAYALCYKNEQNHYLGVLDDHRGIFDFKEFGAPLGIVVTKKDDRSEEICCCCAEEGKISETQDFFTKGLAEPSSAKKDMKKENITEEKPEYVKEYLNTAEDKLLMICKGFQTEKIGGYYLKEKSKILEYILGCNGVHQRITSYGYYIFGKKTEEKQTRFLIAIPSLKNEENPFDNCKQYAFSVASDGVAQDMFYCVMAGTDEKGEFFCRKT